MTSSVLSYLNHLGHGADMDIKTAGSCLWSFFVYEANKICNSITNEGVFPCKTAATDHKQQQQLGLL